MPRPRTKTFVELLPMIASYEGQHGYSPSLREVAVFLGNHSTSYASIALTRLESNGLIRRPRINNRVIPRQIIITAPGKLAAQGASDGQ